MDHKTFYLVIDNETVGTLPIYKNATIGQIKTYLKNYAKKIGGKYEPHIFLNQKDELGVMNTNKYDTQTLESVWDNISDGYLSLLGTNYFKKIPIKTLRNIHMNLEDTDLINACLTSKYVNEKVCNNSFWLDRIKLRFPELSKKDIFGKDYRKRYFYLIKSLKDLDKFLEDAIYDPDLNDIDIIKIGINRGANLHGYYLLPIITANKEKIFKIFIDEGIDVHWNDDEALMEAVYEDRTKMVKLLLEHGANARIKKGDPLAYASSAGNKKMVKDLLKYGANVHDQGDKALRWASREGHADVVRILLEEGAGVHAEGEWALSNASENGHTDVVKILLEEGADIHAEANEALRLAKKNKHKDIVELLQSY